MSACFLHFVFLLYFFLSFQSVKSFNAGLFNWNLFNMVGMFAAVLSVAALLCGPETAQAQIFGVNNCEAKGQKDAAGSFCGDTSTCTPAQNAAALNAFYGYFGGIATGDFAKSTKFTTGNGGATVGSLKTSKFEFVWNGDPSLVPYAGTYTGEKALSEFFGKAMGSLALNANGAPDFGFNAKFSPTSTIPGVQVVASNCQFIVATWEEVSTVKSTGKKITNGVNLVKYTMFDFATPKIAKVEVFTNNMVYQDAVCPGKVTCEDPSKASSAEYSGRHAVLNILLALVVAVVGAAAV